MRRSRMMLRTLSDRTTIAYTHDVSQAGSGPRALRIGSRTFIFTYILQGEGETRIFSLDNPYFSKGTSANDSQ